MTSVPSATPFSLGPAALPTSSSSARRVPSVKRKAIGAPSADAAPLSSSSCLALLKRARADLSCSSEPTPSPTPTSSPTPSPSPSPTLSSSTSSVEELSSGSGFSAAFFTNLGHCQQELEENSFSFKGRSFEAVRLFLSPSPDSGSRVHHVKEKTTGKDLILRYPAPEILFSTASLLEFLSKELELYLQLQSIGFPIARFYHLDPAWETISLEMIHDPDVRISFVKKHLSSGCSLIEYIPDPLPEDLSLEENRPYLDQIAGCFQLLWDYGVYTDFSPASVGVKDGKIRLFRLSPKKALLSKKYPLFALLRAQIASFTLGNTDIENLLWPKNEDGTPVAIKDAARRHIETPLLLAYGKERPGLFLSTAAPSLSEDLLTDPTTPDFLCNSPSFQAWQATYQSGCADAYALGPEERQKLQTALEIQQKYEDADTLSSTSSPELFSPSSLGPSSPQLSTRRLSPLVATPPFFPETLTPLPPTPSLFPIQETSKETEESDDF